MTLHDEMHEKIRRIGEAVRDGLPMPSTQNKTFTAPKFSVRRTPQNFNDLRRWLYRICLFLPEEFFGRPLSLEDEKGNPKGNSVRDLKPSASVEIVVDVCNRNQLPFPWRRSERDNGKFCWSDHNVVSCFRELLSIGRLFGARRGVLH